jgi:hypothetical protein
LEESLEALRIHLEVLTEVDGFHLHCLDFVECERDRLEALICCSQSSKHVDSSHSFSVFGVHRKISPCASVIISRVDDVAELLDRQITLDTAAETLHVFDPNSEYSERDSRDTRCLISLVDL